MDQYEPIGQRMKVRFISILLFFLITSCSPDQEDFLYPTSGSAPSQAPYWKPLKGMTLQIQFSGTFDDTVDADIYDLDLFDTQEDAITDLHTRGKKVVCYMSVGSWEDWRPDAGDFPSEVIGKNYSGWPGEKWLDVRRLEDLQPIMSARLDLCALKGFDGVEPDNIEVLGNDTGFPISYHDQLAYALWLAEEAHARGLAIGLKNAPEMVEDVLDNFDFAILEDCFLFEWCAELLPFIQADKPVFAVEYTDMHVDFAAACSQPDLAGFYFLLKHCNLDAFRQSCP